MERVRLGQVTAPVGIKGEIRVFPYVDRESRFSDIKKVYIGEELTEYTIEKYRKDKDLIVLKLLEVKDRNTSESLRLKYIYALKDDYVLETDTYFVEDLINISVFSEDNIYLGKLIEVIQNTAQDIYAIEKDDKRVFYVPAVKEFIKALDIENKKMIIHVIEGLV